MARRPSSGGPSASGVGDALVFLAFVAGGAGYIVWAKLNGVAAAAVPAGPVWINLL